jgi:hypothetical protein
MAKNFAVVYCGRGFDSEIVKKKKEEIKYILLIYYKNMRLSFKSKSFLSIYSTFNV